MNWETEGFLLSKKKFRENANIISVFTKTKGKVSGIVYGGNSRKIRNYLQIGNKIFLSYSSKNENSIGYFKTELIDPISPKFFDNKEKTTAIMSTSNLLNQLLPESQNHQTIYRNLELLNYQYNYEYWIIHFIFWELKLIKELGYGFNLEKFKDNQDNLQIIKFDGVNYSVPKYLIQDYDYGKISKKEIKDGLNFTRNIYMNKFFIPNNLIFPQNRILLEKYYA